MLLFSRNHNAAFFIFIGCQFRIAWAFAPTLGAVRQWRLGSSPVEGSGMLGKDAAGKALEQAAKLRQEIAELEQDLSKEKRAGEDDVQYKNGENGGELLTNAGSDALTQPPSSQFSLAPTRWLISMDIGREKGTWMPQSWGVSGRRLEVDLLIQFLAGGKMLVDVDSPFIAMKVAPGRWNVGPAEGTSRPRPNKNASNLSILSDTCRFWVETEGFARGDVTIPAGKVFFAVPCWGGKLSRKGLVTVRQKRWLVREESRILGVFGTERIEADVDGRIAPRAPRSRKPPFASGYKDG